MRFSLRFSSRSFAESRHPATCRQTATLRFEALEPRTLLSVVPVGAEFRVNSYTTNNQRFPAIAMDADGDFVVTWVSLNQDGSTYGVYAQRYNMAGVAQGGEFRVNTYTTNDQNAPAVAMDADGNFVVVWHSSFGQDGSGDGIYAQRYNAAGVAQGGEFRVNTRTTGSQEVPSIAMDADGDFVVVWRSYGQDGDEGGIYAQRYDAAGVAQGAEFRVNSYTTNEQSSPAVAMDADGDFVVAWYSSGQDGNNNGIYAQRYDAAGVAHGGEFLVNTYTTGNQAPPNVAMDFDGDFVVVWRSTGQDGSVDGVYAQRYNAAGVAQGSEFRVNAYTTNQQSLPSVAMDADGNFVVAWQSFGQDGSSDGVYAQRYGATGALQGGEFLVNTFTTNFQRGPAIGMEANGDFVIAWHSSNAQDGDGYGIYAQRYQIALPGDLDEDGDVDADDIDSLFALIDMGDPAADLNGDSVVNQDDMDYMVNAILETTYGDADLDGDVDGADFDAWRIRDSLGGGIGWATGDFDGDDDVDGADFDLWRLRPVSIPGGESLTGSNSDAAPASRAALAEPVAHKTALAQQVGQGRGDAWAAALMTPTSATTPAPSIEHMLQLEAAEQPVADSHLQLRRDRARLRPVAKLEPLDNFFAAWE